MSTLDSYSIEFAGEIPPKYSNYPPSRLMSRVKALEPTQGIELLCSKEERDAVRRKLWGLTRGLRKQGLQFVTRSLPHGIGLWRVS